MAVRNAMVRTTDLRQPMDLKQQLLHRSGLSNDVGQAMMDLLQVIAENQRSKMPPTGCYIYSTLALMTVLSSGTDIWQSAPVSSPFESYNAPTSRWHRQWSSTHPRWSAALILLLAVQPCKTSHSRWRCLSPAAAILAKLKLPKGSWKAD